MCASVPHSVPLPCSVCSKETVRVHATVTEHSKTAKVIVFKKKRRKNYKRKRGMYMYIVHEYVCVHVYVYGTMYVVG